MAKTNYAFEKRQREIAKKKKKEAKRLQKAEVDNGEPEGVQVASSEAEKLVSDD